MLWGYIHYCLFNTQVPWRLGTIPYGFLLVQGLWIFFPFLFNAVIPLQNLWLEQVYSLFCTVLAMQKDIKVWAVERFLPTQGSVMLPEQYKGLKCKWESGPLNLIKKSSASYRLFNSPLNSHEEHRRRFSKEQMSRAPNSHWFLNGNWVPNCLLKISHIILYYISQNYSIRISMAALSDIIKLSPFPPLGVFHCLIILTGMEFFPAIQSKFCYS